MAHTTKPCPGCGHVDRYRPADKVCESCQKKLARIAEIEAEAEQLRATVAAALALETKPRTLFVPEKGWGIVYDNRMGDSPEYADLKAKTEVMFLALLAPLDRHRKDEWRSRGAVPARSDHWLSANLPSVETTDEGAEAAKMWWTSLKSFSQACYGAGVEDGRNLLGQLAAGEMTVTQMNDIAFEMVNRKRRY